MSGLISTAVAATLSGILGSMGFGGGSVLIIYLTIFTATPQSVAQGINLIFFLPIALLAIIIHSREKLIVWNIAIPIIIFGIIGALAGAYTSTIVNPVILRKLFGFFLLAIGIQQLFYKNKIK